MPFTDFPSGLTSFGIPLLGGGSSPATLPITSGRYIFACSLGGTGGVGDGTSMSQPLASVFASGGAYGNAVAARGDVIVVLPGHTETIGSATAAAMSKSGVQIVGLGWSTLRPTFTLDTANTSTIAVSADNQGFTNCVFRANFLSIAACFTLTTAKGFSLQNCLFQDVSGVLDFLNIVKSTGAANTVDGLSAISNQWNGLGTTSVNAFFLTANDVDGATLLGNTIDLVTTTNAASLIIVTAGVLTNLNCGYNRTYRKNTTATVSLISVGGTTSVGFVYYNFTQTLDTATNVLFVTSVGLAAFENRITGVVGASGFLIPAADT